jgi:hypothetical protein
MIPNESDMVTVRRDCIAPVWQVDVLKEKVQELLDQAVEREAFILFLQSQIN